MTEIQTQTVALDVMGADRGSAEVIQGGIDAARDLGDAIHIILVGQQDKIEACLATIKDVPANVSTVHAPVEITMSMGTTEAVRRRDSSMAVGLRLVRRKEAHAFVSPGHTGAVMGTSLLTLGRIKGVARPAIAGVFPTATEIPCVVLDVGANSDCKPHHLEQFAVMGSIYSQILFDIKSPRVGLVSIGEEQTKGKELIFSASKLLRESKINFVGNIEGRDILVGGVHVAVMDGFTGNILLKFGESIKPFLVKKIGHQVKTNLFSRVGAMLLLPFLSRLKKTFDYAQTGGAPLLGVNGVVIICHGSSNSVAIRNALRIAHDMSKQGLNQRIKDELTNNHFGSKHEPADNSQNLRNGVVHSAGGDDQR
jgi:glycerol-3-phosphate acyltransferase PlsX